MTMIHITEERLLELLDLSADELFDAIGEIKADQIQRNWGYDLGEETAAHDMAALIAELKAERDALVDRLESLTIAIGMGRDLEGVVSEARAALAKIKEKNDE